MTHYFIMKIPNKRKFQQIALNHSSDIEFKDFIKLYKELHKDYLKELFSTFQQQFNFTIRKSIKI